MIGDDIYITEDTYTMKVGSLVMTVELLAKRILAKDAAINELEGKVKVLSQRLEEKEETNNV